QVLIRADQVAARVQRQQEYRDKDASEQVTEGKLDEAIGAEVGDARHADDGECRGFGRDDREAHRPPRQVALADEIIGGRALLATDAQSDRRNRDKIDGDDSKIDHGFTSLLQGTVTIGGIFYMDSSGLNRYNG